MDRLQLSRHVAQVLDARGFRCLEVEQAVMAHSDNRLVIVLNKGDLVPRENLQVTSSHLLLASISLFPSPPGLGEVPLAGVHHCFQCLHPE